MFVCMFVDVCVSDLIWLGKIEKGGGGERIKSNGDNFFL